MMLAKCLMIAWGTSAVAGECFEESCAHEEVALLQVQKAQTGEAGCPLATKFTEGGKDCPNVNGRYDCLNRNKGYASLSDALDACGKVDGCATIMKFGDSKFYLRRSSDPERKDPRSTLYQIRSATGGKDCPKQGGTYNCLNGNKGYASLSAALDKCKAQADCGAIMKYRDGKFYLRRTSDPDSKDPSSKLYEIRKECASGYDCLNENKGYSSLNAARKKCKRVDGCGTIMEYKDGKFYLRRNSDPDRKDKSSKLHQITRTRGGKDCPKKPDQYFCLNGNKGFPSLSQALDRCKEMAACGAIMKYSDGKFYLRRSSDPDSKRKKCRKCKLFQVETTDGGKDCPRK